MQQLDLFNKSESDATPGKKLNILVPANAAEDDLMLQDSDTQVSEKEADAYVPDNMQPTNPTPQAPQAKSAQPAKRGRKSYKETDIDVALLDIPDEETLRQKQYYSISEVAEWFHVNTSLVRFWEKEFDILKPRKNRKGDRLFRPEDIKNLRLIYYLLRQQKFSIEGARQFLKDNKKKAEIQVQLAETLIKFRSFLFELKAN